jgi:iron complex outermembrane receptor protein
LWLADPALNANGFRAGLVSSVFKEHLVQRILSKWSKLSLGCIILASASQAVHAEETAVGVEDLTKMNLEDLLNVEVSSVSKHKQKVSGAAAAVTVISQDDIRRSHLDSVPELLRLSPGVDVARLNANTWAISAGGYNDVFANKLLVLMDGRTVYTPLFSGVFWDLQETIVADLDRIEVIRGPGATLWGANAVNGVINITSKSARDTQGGLVDSTIGEYGQRGAVRYGGKLDADTYYRVWGQYRGVNDFPMTGGGEGFDGWGSLSGGFRVDRYAGPDDTLTLIGNFGKTHQADDQHVPSLLPPYFSTNRTIQDSNSQNILGRWTHVISERSDFTVQAYFDRIDHPSTGFRYKLNLADIDFQHRFPLGDRQEIIYGAGYRFSTDDVGPGDRGVFVPRHRDDYIANAFVQDDLTIVKDRLHFILGTKLEQNSYSGFEVQPSARLLYTPSEKQTVWGSVSRAVRTPSRWEQDSSLQFQALAGPGGASILTASQPNKSFQSENELAYELGHRYQATKSLSFDTTAFYHQYDHLRSFEPGVASFDPAPPVPHINVPIRLQNKLAADTLGVEVAANWKVTSNWRLSGSYSFLTTEAQNRGSHDPTTAEFLEGGNPRNQSQVHSYLDLTKNLEFDASLYFVDSLAYLKVPSYFRADLALTWKPRENMEFTVGVQNLLAPRHREYGSLSTDIQATEIPRTVFAQLTYRF